MCVVCRSVGSSSLTVDFKRSLKVLICCVDFLRLWQCFIKVRMKLTVLKLRPLGHQQVERKSAALWIAAAILWLTCGSVEQVGWAAFLASESLG